MVCDFILHNIIDYWYGGAFSVPLGSEHSNSRRRGGMQGDRQNGGANFPEWEMGFPFMLRFYEIALHDKLR